MLLLFIATGLGWFFVLFYLSCSEAVVQRCSVRKVFLEISPNSQENTCARVSFSIKLRPATLLKKETLAQVFSCEFCKISKNIFFTEHLWWLLLSSIGSIFTDLPWYFGIFRFETTWIKKLLRISATLSFLSKIKSCSTNVILLLSRAFFQKREAY